MSNHHEYIKQNLFYRRFLNRVPDIALFIVCAFCYYAISDNIVFELFGMDFIDIIALVFLSASLSIVLYRIAYTEGYIRGSYDNYDYYKQDNMTDDYI